MFFSTTDLRALPERERGLLSLSSLLLGWEWRGSRPDELRGRSFGSCTICGARRTRGVLRFLRPLVLAEDAAEPAFALGEVEQVGRVGRLGVARDDRTEHQAVPVAR